MGGGTIYIYICILCIYIYICVERDIYIYIYEDGVRVVSIRRYNRPMTNLNLKPEHPSTNRVAVEHGELQRRIPSFVAFISGYVSGSRE